jgi:zinc protease
VLIGFPGPSLTDDDMPAMDVMSLILGEGRSSRLYQEAREKRGLVNGITSLSYTPSFPGIFGVWANLAPEKIQALTDLMWKEFDRLKTEPVRKEELEKAKAQTIREHYHSLETTSGQASDLGSSEVMAKNVTFSEEYIKRVAAVSAEDIVRVARKYLRKEASNEVSLLPKEIREETRQTSFDPAKEPPITFHTLKNGLRILIREDHSIPTVTLRVLLKGGLLAETKENNGLSHLFAEMLIQGTQKRSNTQMVQQLENVGGGISSYSGNNSMGFSIDVLSDQQNLAYELVQEILVEPAFREEDMAREKQAILLDIRSLEDQIYQTTSKLFRETMFKGHPYQYVSVGSKASVEGLGRGDLLSFYEDYVVGPNIVIAVYGDVRAQEVLKNLERGLTRLPGQQASFLKYSPVPITSPQKVFKAQEGKQAMILLGYPTVDIYHADRYILEVLDALFTGQGSRLFDAIRETQGLAYMVGSYQLLGLDLGAFVFYVGTVPESVDAVVEQLFAEIKKIKSQGVDTEELERAKRGLIGTRKIQLQTNAQLAMQTGLDELYGLGWDDYKKYYQRIRVVSEEDIKRVARTYFTDQGCVLSIVKPSGYKESPAKVAEDVVKIGER